MDAMFVWHFAGETASFLWQILFIHFICVCPNVNALCLMLWTAGRNRCNGTLKTIEDYKQGGKPCPPLIHWEWQSCTFDDKWQHSRKTAVEILTIWCSEINGHCEVNLSPEIDEWGQWEEGKAAVSWGSLWFQCVLCCISHLRRGVSTVLRTTVFFIHLYHLLSQIIQ